MFGCTILCYFIRATSFSAPFDEKTVNEDFFNLTQSCFEVKIAIENSKNELRTRLIEPRRVSKLVIISTCSYT